jgi:arginase
MFKNLIFFQNGRGQKRFGIEKTVKKLYKYYNYKYEFMNISTHFIQDTECLKTNLYNLYNINNKILYKNQFPINIGGDHSMAIGSLGSTLNLFTSDVKVIWIDAHTDINTKLSSPSGNIHGMPLAYLSGLDKSPDYNYLSYLLNLNNLCYIGIRDLDKEEINTINKYKIKKILSPEFNSNIDDVCQDIIKWVGNSKLHLSIDVDSLDPKYLQHTGTRAPNGLELDKLIKFIKEIKDNCSIVNVDIAELNLYNPDCDNLSKKEKIKSFNNFNLILKTLL